MRNLIWPLNVTGWIALSWIASFRMMDNLSKHIINKYGDKGSPWCTLLDVIIGDKGVPFHIILKRVEKIIFIIRWISLEGIWKNSSVF